MWTLSEHLINAAIWATVGTMVALPFIERQDGMMKAAALAGVAIVYSYGTDIISGIALQ
jgi:hypothetical protein